LPGFGKATMLALASSHGGSFAKRLPQASESVRVRCGRVQSGGHDGERNQAQDHGLNDVS